MFTFMLTNTLYNYNGLHYNYGSISTTLTCLLHNATYVTAHPHLSEPLSTERCPDKGNNTICIATYSTLWRTVVSTFIPSEASCVALSYYLH